MPDMNDVRNTADELQNGILEGLEEQIQFLPQGEDARRIAEMTLESTKGVLDAARSGNLDKTTFPTHFARLYYLEQVRDGKQTLTSAEVEEKAAALAKNEKFLEVFADKRGPDNCMNVLNSFFDGPRAAHLDSWVKECEHPVTRDYGQEFETLCGNKLQGAERETAKQHFMNMGLLNEEIRVLDYSKALSPTRMYERLTSKTLQDEKAAEEKFRNSLTEKANQVNAAMQLQPTAPSEHSRTNPLARLAPFFYDHSGTAAALENNQKLVDRLHSDAPEDKAFQKEFTLNCINKMLAVPEEALCPKTFQDAAKSLDVYYFEMRALQESSNFLGTLSREYQVPEYVQQALKHKGDLYMQNVEKYVKGNEIDPAYYEELSLLKDFDSDTIGNISGNLFHKGEHALGSAVVTFAATTHDLKQSGETMPNRERYDALILKDLSPVQKAAQATASDAFSLTPDFAKKPKEPSGWVKFWNNFGFYKEEMAAYEREKTAYNKWMKAHPHQADFKKAAAFGANGDNAANIEQELAKQTSLALDKFAKEAGAEYKQTLDNAFGMLEQQTKNAINRLDYVMVGPRSLRAVLQEEYLKTHANCKELIDSQGTELSKYCKQSLENGHAYEVLAHATLEYVPVQYATLNNKAEVATTDDGKIKMTSLATPLSLTKLSAVARPKLAKMSAQQFSKRGMILAGVRNSTDRMHFTDNSRAALHQLNFWSRVNCACNKSAPIAPKEGNVFSLSDAAVHALVEARMLDDDYNMTPEQVYDVVNPDKVTKGVKEMAESVLKNAVKDPDGADEVATIAVNAIQKINDLVNEYTKGADLTKEIGSPKVKTVYELVFTAATLNAEVFCNDQLKTAASKAWATNHGMDPEKPEDLKKASQELTVFSNRLAGLDAAFEHVRVGRFNGCRYCMGAVTGAIEGTKEIFTGEMALKVVSDRMKAGTPLTDCVSLSESQDIHKWGFFIGNPFVPGSGHRELQDLCTVNKAMDGMKFASYALSGGLAHDCKVEIGGKANSIEQIDVGAKFTYTPPQPEMVADSVVAELDLTQPEPNVEQGLMA